MRITVKELQNLSNLVGLGGVASICTLLDILDGTVFYHRFDFCAHLTPPLRAAIAVPVPSFHLITHSQRVEPYACAPVEICARLHVCSV